MDAIAAFARHVVRTRHDDLPAAAIAAVKTFILDSFGVGVAGSAAPHAKELLHVAMRWGSGGDARVWVLGAALPAPTAALCIGYTYTIPSTTACTRRPWSTRWPCCCPRPWRMRSGRAACPDATSCARSRSVSTSASGWVLAPRQRCGSSTRNRRRFAATAAIGRLMDFDAKTLTHAFGIVYGQVCGTMQAHTEGSPLLAMQIGFNARNAVAACDLAAGGLLGPQDILEGPFGFYRLSRAPVTLRRSCAILAGSRGSPRLREPFPCGRATHGVLDRVPALMRQHSFVADEVELIECWCHR